MSKPFFDFFQKFRYLNKITSDNFTWCFPQLVNPNGNASVKSISKDAIFTQTVLLKLYSGRF